ncbi:hypothetical protein QFZ37_002847 [Chryseobacterium ginsenosidimutans]|uniref:DUF6261 family protein n=1 Tax=Chryseobacterium ginsenosidimutans TaxID=687846 RepID=UPI0027814446|nr:DUF6261 family protein [Chryseobacterium ginsenosidimutans]MDQ0594478.1 hypothetical protein [Chryseobacterium ginsenosidimutans]
MKKLISMDAAKLHHAELGQLIVRFYEDFGTSALDPNTDPDFKRMFDAIQAQIPNYNSALDQVRASEESAKIADLDAIRDADIQALRDAIRPYRNAKTPTEQDGYDLIKILLDQYKNVQNESYEEETNRLNTLLEKLLSSEYSTAVSALGLVKFINHLADSNTAFNDLFSHRSFKTSQKQVYDVKALRKLLTIDYKQMCNYIATLADVKSDPFYQDVLAIINNGRSYFANIVLARRQGKKNNSQPE